MFKQAYVIKLVAVEGICALSRWVMSIHLDAVAIFALAVFINVIGNYVTPFLNGLLFLDMIGTALAATALGPWWGATVGVLTNCILAQLPGKQQYLNYIIVNVAGALVWGYLGRGWLALFPRRNSMPRVFFTILGLGAICGIVCSTLAMYTRLRFVWTLTPQIVNTLPELHPTDHIVKWAVTSGWIHPDAPTFRLLPLDAISIIPDKIFSTSLAAFLLFYFFPRVRAEVTYQVRTHMVVDRWLSVGFFFLAYSYFLIKVCKDGYIVVGPSTVTTQRIVAQMIVCSIPVGIAAVDLIRSSRHSALAPKVTEEDTNPGLKMEEIYRDVLAVVGSVYVLLLTTRGKYSSSEIAASIRDGIGIAGFITLFGILPVIIMRYCRGCLTAGKHG